MSQSNEIQNIPVVAMRGVVIFPKMVMHFDVARTASMNAIYAAAESDRKVFLVAQKDVFVEEPKEADLYRYGVLAEVRQILKTQDNALRVLVEGKEKAKLMQFQQNDSH